MGGMSKNIGFTKKEAEKLAKLFCRCGEWDIYGEVEAYAQKEEHIDKEFRLLTEWVVVLRKRRDE